MARISAVFCCGHESRYGLAHLEPLLRSEVLNVQEVILAPLERWNTFRSALTGLNCPSSITDKWRFARRTRAVAKRIKSLRNCRIRFVSDVNTDAETEKFRGYDLLISAAYPQLFQSRVIAAPRLGAINFHPSFLPRCRGAHPIYWTIASGEPFGGVSCHIMTEHLDAGPLIAQRKIEFDPDTITYHQLYALVENETPKLVKEVEAFFQNRGNPAPQIGEVSYFRSDRELHRKVYFLSETPETISAKIRAGGAFAFDKLGRKILLQPPVSISKSSCHVTNQIGPKLLDGTVTSQSKDEIEIKVHDCYIKVHFRILRSNPIGRISRKVSYALGLKNYEKLSIGEVLH